jgi:chromosome partitioning protein
VNVVAREARLQKSIAAYEGDIDYIFIDCPPSLGLLTVNALVAADAVLIPLHCEYFALEGISHLLSTVHLVQRSMNERLSVDGVLLTMHDPRLNLSRQVAADAREFFGDKVYQTVIPRNVRLAEAPSFGKPIILYDLASVGAQAYVNLAKEVLERHHKPTVPQPVPVADAPALAPAVPASTDISDNTPLSNHHDHGETSATR